MRKAKGPRDRDLTAELDDFDLLSDPELGSEEGESLAQAVSGLSARLQKRIDDHRQAESEADKETRFKQLLLLSALMRARKTVRGVVSLQVSKDVELQLRCDDFQGWPRIALQPIAWDNIERLFSRFEITGSDRTGVAEINLLIPGRPLREGLVLSQEEDLNRLPRILKRFLRHYFDILAEEILAPPVTVDEAPIQELGEVAKKETKKADALSSASLFEEALQEEILERLPEIDETRNLGGLD